MKYFQPEVDETYIAICSVPAVDQAVAAVLRSQVSTTWRSRTTKALWAIDKYGIAAAPEPTSDGADRVRALVL
jgi:hypothetical protein